MRKKALLALMLALTLMLSGCALIVKDEAVDNATEIIRMGDKVLTKGEVKEEVENQLASTAYMYNMYGMSYDTTDASNIAAAQEQAIEALKKDLALTAKAKELGLDVLTDEEKEEVSKEAQDSYDYAVSYAETNLVEDKTLEGDALTEAAKAVLTERGVTLETYTESETKSKIDEKLREYAIKDVAVTDEEIQADYDSKVEADKATYGENPGSYATAVNNRTTVYYAPAGVRRVKQILTKFKDEDQTAIDEANTKVSEANTAVSAANAKISAAQEVIDEEEASEEAKTDAQADLAAAQAELEEANKALEEANKAVEEATAKAFENIDADTDAILAKIDEEGSDWQALMDEYNQDPGMSTMTKGYAIAADMTGFDSAFVDAALALEKVGDHSGKVKGASYGYYIIRYDSDEPEGPIALDEVKETISSALLDSKQDDAYDAAVEKWVEEANIKVDTNALKD